MRVGVPLLNHRIDVTNRETQPQSEAEAAATKLDRGLKSCRTLISGYRSLLLASDKPSPEPVEQETATPPQT